jgi:hypothetical protein
MDPGFQNVNHSFYHRIGQFNYQYPHYHRDQNNRFPAFYFKNQNQSSDKSRNDYFYLEISLYYHCILKPAKGALKAVANFLYAVFCFLGHKIDLN